MSCLYISSDFSSTVPPETVVVSPAHSTSRGEPEDSGGPVGGGLQGPAGSRGGEPDPPGDRPTLRRVQESAGELFRSDGNKTCRTFFHSVPFTRGPVR